MTEGGERDEGQDHEHSPAWPVDARLVNGLARAVRAEYVPAAPSCTHGRPPDPGPGH